MSHFARHHSRRPTDTSDRKAREPSARLLDGYTLLGQYIDVRHIANQISLAHIFIRAAQKDYGLGNIVAGDESRAAAKAALLEATRFRYQIGSERQLLLTSELNALEFALDDLTALRA